MLGQPRRPYWRQKEDATFSRQTVTMYPKDTNVRRINLMGLLTDRRPGQIYIWDENIVFLLGVLFYTLKQAVDINISTVSGVQNSAEAAIIAC